MRTPNWRFVSTGLVMIVSAAATYFVAPGLLPRSNDPVALMTTLGQVSGVVGALGVVLVVLGALGKRI